MTNKYQMPATLSTEDIAFNLGMFLLENTGSIGGKWKGTIAVADQKKLAFRKFSGKKQVYLNGETGRIIVSSKAAFGFYVDFAIDTAWANFEKGLCF